MKIRALALTALVAALCAGLSYAGDKGPGVNREYSAELLKRDMEGDDPKFCAYFTGSKEWKLTAEEDRNKCHVTRNYLVDIKNKVDGPKGYPHLAHERYRRDDAERDILRAKLQGCSSADESASYDPRQQSR